MERLRYEGYELPAMSLVEARQFAGELRKRLAPIARREVNRWYAERAVTLLDLAHFTPPNELDAAIEKALGARFSEADGEAPAAHLVHRAFGRARRLQDRALDMSAYLDLFPLERTALALIESRNDMLRTEAIGDERFQDCVYYVNDTPSEGISQAEWIRREALWRAALLPSGDDRIERIRLVLHENTEIPGPDDQAALPGRVTLHDRVSEHARRMVVDARLKVLQEAVSTGDDTVSVHARAAQSAAPYNDPTARVVASILSEHLPESYAPDGYEAAAGLNELFDSTLYRRLARALEAVSLSDIAPVALTQPNPVQSYLRRLVR